MTLAVLRATAGGVSIPPRIAIVRMGENTRMAAASAATATNAALAASAAANYYSTIAAGVAATSVGGAFSSAEGGALKLYERTGTSPFYVEIGELDGALRADLAADTGAALVGTSSGGTVEDALALRAPAGFGALTPASTALATIQAAFASLGAGGMLGLTDEVNIGSAAAANPGVDFIGEHGLYYEGASGGRRVMNKPGRDPALHQWGRENLLRWLEGLRAGETLKVALVGDSNMAGYIGTPLQSYLDSLPNVSVSNFAVSGTQIEQWRTATNPYDSNSKSLANVIAFDPDLIVMCWGTNDPVVGSRTAEDFATSLQAALTTLRASLGVNVCSIVLLTPNAMGDTSDRDELWSLRIRPIIRAMAERFDCGFFDKNALFPNSAIDLAAGAMQNKWLDSARVHTATLSTNIIAAMIAEWLVPRELWAMVWDNIPEKAAADTAATYPPGLTIARMADGQFNGFVATINPISPGGHFATQFNWAYSGSDSRMAYRVALGGVWSSWITFGPIQTDTKAAADAASTYSAGLSYSRMSDAPLDGFVATFIPTAATNYAFQINWAYSGTDARFYWRVATSGIWSSWTSNGPDALAVVGSIASGYASPGGSTALNSQRTGTMVSLSGRLTVSPAAQIIATTTLCNIATASHRPLFNIQDAVVVALNAGGTVERLRADVTTLGDVVVRESSTMTDATTVSINLTYRGA